MFTLLHRLLTTSTRRAREGNAVLHRHSRRPSALRTPHAAFGHRPLHLESLENRSLLTAGALDPSFGTAGLVTTDFSPTDEGACGHCVVVAPDGKIIVAGYSDQGGATGSDFTVARYTPSGSLDASFGIGGKLTIDFGSTNDGATALVVQSDGRVLLGGYTSDQTGDPFSRDFAFVRLTTAGQLDPSFGVGGKVMMDVYGDPYDQPAAMAIQSDGSIVAAASKYTGTGADISVFCLTSSGLLDTSFGTSGVTTIDFGGYDGAADLALQNDGSIVVAGGTSVNDNFSVAKLTSNGVLDATFGTGGKATIDFGGTDYAVSVAVQSDGAVVLAGYTFQPFNYDFAVVRLTSTGQLDTSFNGTGKQTVEFPSPALDPYRFAFPNDVAVQPDGSVVVAGYMSNYYDIDFAVARLTSAGQADASFGTDGKTTIRFNAYDVANAVALQADGKIIVAGTSRDEFNSGASSVFALARLLGEDLPVQSVSVNIQPDSLNLDSNGTLTVLIYGAADFNASQIDVSTVRFAGASAWQSSLVDANHDGRLDLQLKFRRQDTALEQIYVELLRDDHDADGVLDSSRQIASVEVTGQTLDDAIFSGQDSITLFLAGKSLRDLLRTLFGS